MRVSAVRQGLYVRCTAMVECGWTWGEMGKEGLRALEGMDMSNSHGELSSALCIYVFAFPESGLLSLAAPEITKMSRLVGSDI